MAVLNVEADKPNLRLGLISAFAILLIWSGFLVFSRAGVRTNLTPEDMAMLRFVVAGGLTAPFVFRWWPRHLPLGVIALVALTGPGIVYCMTSYYGLAASSAAYGGVFANGTVPLFTVATIAIVTGVWPSRGQTLALAVIILGGAIFAFPGLAAAQSNPWLAISFFLVSSLVVSIYIFVLKHWQLTPRQALALVNIPNAVVFLPVWFFFLPSGIAETAPSMIAFQALFQGLGPGFVAVILFALSARHLGPTGTAGFSAAVPASAAVLAIPVLGEVLTPIEWLGVATVTCGLGLLVAVKR